MCSTRHSKLHVWPTKWKKPPRTRRKHKPSQERQVLEKVGQGTQQVMFTILIVVKKPNQKTEHITLKNKRFKLNFYR